MQGGRVVDAAFTFEFFFSFPQRLDYQILADDSGFEWLKFPLFFFLVYQMAIHIYIIATSKRIEQNGPH